MNTERANTESLKTQSWWAYLQLLRPANVVTAWADILAGVAAAGAIALPLNPFMERLPTLSDLGAIAAPVLWLLLATTGLYGGGIVFNDVFDAVLDAEERPERPIPSGRVSRTAAAGFAALLLAIGIAAATQVSLLSAVLAGTVALLALLYDAAGKHHPWLGPLNMGCCRGGNLLLGISIVPAMAADRWFLVLIPILYIAAITTVSRGEVQGCDRTPGKIALSLMSTVIIGLVALAILSGYSILSVLPLVFLLAIRVFPAFVQATLDPSPETIRNAVKAGVLSLIVLDASLGAGFAGWVYGLLVLALLPLSTLLGRFFAVT